MNTNEALITRFYTAFSNFDAETMAKCYHPSMEFQDPAFGNLKGKEVQDMWRMLILRSKGELKIEFFDVTANDKTGSANWIATYNFSKTNRKVVNIIHAEFEFEDGLIRKHKDAFNVWKWTRQALGLPGYLLGWTPFLQKKIQQQSRELLTKYQEKYSNI
ncbi:nuclear transport factor 2 family protein [Flavobacterium sp. GT3R68]|uniref:nuclear transport factor 2 family protein n=1 Tax=Flavobacterium sp. GT3R68 TaxID=2594437 RepID=UPI000F86967F|nr:nuclear transport factor 2 family protein [Flavobacterium sp. GT3R68]RTY95002.1 nuclear transport factor 2 family protein [Flavobacterium sp. GSN2]TRW91807.1 nuclear transport factor 2 family protein [Flavobacterium sp. GT3R68]